MQMSDEPRFQAQVAADLLGLLVLAGLTLVAWQVALQAGIPASNLVSGLPGCCSWLVVGVAWSGVGRAAFRAEGAPDCVARLRKYLFRRGCHFCSVRLAWRW